MRQWLKESNQESKIFMEETKNLDSDEECMSAKGDIALRYTFG